MSRNVVEPKFMPVSFADGSRSAIVAVFQLAVLCAPGFLIFILSGNALIAGVLCVALYLFYGLQCISETTVDESGIYFKRSLGSPTYIPWTEVTSMVEVSPKEVIILGWLWPFFPAREMTPSLTSVGHYRITFGKRWIYFPPKTPDQLFYFWPGRGAA
jgi:hypothetical protein